MDSLDRLDAWSELPDEIHVLELGVGDGEQAHVWLETFAAACRERGRDYLERLRYLMADYSPHVLARARERVADYGDARRRRSSSTSATRWSAWSACRARCSSPTPPTSTTTSPPTRSCASATAATSRSCARASRPTRSRRSPRSTTIAQEEIVARIQHIIRNGPALAARTPRRPSSSGPTCGTRSTSRRSTSRSPRRRRCASRRPRRRTSTRWCEDMPDWTRVHRSTVAVESFAQTLMLLHHEGVLVAQDLFIREVSQYGLYRGPGKLEGSIVNWLNGPIFQIVGERLGFKVDVEPFAYREGSNTAVLTARHRDTNRVALGDGIQPAEDADLASAAHRRRTAVAPPSPDGDRPLHHGGGARHQPRADHRDARPARAGDRPRAGRGPAHRRPLDHRQPGRRRDAVGRHDGDRPHLPRPGGDHPPRLQGLEPQRDPEPRVEAVLRGLPQHPRAVRRRADPRLRGRRRARLRHRLRRAAADVQRHERGDGHPRPARGRAGRAHAVLPRRGDDEPQAQRERGRAAAAEAAQEGGERRPVHRQPDRLQRPQGPRAAAVGPRGGAADQPAGERVRALAGRRRACSTPAGCPA